MNTPLDYSNDTAGHGMPTRKRWPRFALGGGVTAALVGGILAASNIGGGTAEPPPKAPITTLAKSKVTYKLGAPDLLNSCMHIDMYVPVPGTVAFGGTVTSVGDGTVTIDVDRWYANGTADEVVLSTDGTPSPALDGVEFTQGGRYLVSVIDGTVGICGASGPASPELGALFDRWFAA